MTNETILQLWGTRGSIPAPSGRTPSGKINRTEVFGGNTTCFRIIGEHGEQNIIDAGTGIRTLGLDYMEQYAGQTPPRINILFTHYHWDHIQGLPFFVPAYVKPYDIHAYGSNNMLKHIRAVKNPDASIREMVSLANNAPEIAVQEALRAQQDKVHFPVGLEILAGMKEYNDFTPGELILQENAQPIETYALNHPEGCVGYKFTDKNGIVAVCTDFEPDFNGKDDTLGNIIAGSHLLIADGQYERGSTVNKFMTGYGHSDPFFDVDLALRYGVKVLVITHHEPKMNDDYLADLEKRLQQYLAGQLVAQGKSEDTLKVHMGREGDNYILSDGGVYRKQID